MTYCHLIAVQMHVQNTSRIIFMLVMLWSVAHLYKNTRNCIGNIGINSAYSQIFHILGKIRFNKINKTFFFSLLLGNYYIYYKYFSPFSSLPFGLLLFPLLSTSPFWLSDSVYVFYPFLSFPASLILFLPPFQGCVTGVRKGSCGLTLPFSVMAS